MLISMARNRCFRSAAGLPQRGSGVAGFPSAGDVDKILIDEKSCNSDEDAGLRMHGPEFVL